VSIDWFVLLTPIVLLIVALPLLFVGCAKFTAEPGSTTEPDPPPGRGATPTPVRGTTFRLEMDPNLQQGLGNRRVVSIDVVFRFTSSTGGVPQLELPQPHQLIKSAQVPPADPPAVDPVKDRGVSFTIADADLGPRDRASCVCKVTLDNGNTPNVTGTNKAVTIVNGRTFEFRIRSRKPGNNGFDVYANGA